VAAGVILAGGVTPVRLAMAGLAGAGIVGLSLARASSRSPRASSAVAGIAPALAAAAMICAGLLLASSAGEPAAADRLGQSAERATAWRRPLWAFAARAVAASPWTGPGHHGFYAAIQSGAVAVPPAVAEAHNLYLSLAVAGGIPALLLFAAGLAGLLRRARDGRDAASAGLLWYWLAYAGAGLVGGYPLPVNDALAFWFVSALTLARPSTPR
jgi:O-antigen ligase